LLKTVAELGLFVDESIHSALEETVVLLGFPLIVLTTNRALNTIVSRKSLRREYLFKMVPDLQLMFKIGGRRALFAGLLPYTLFAVFFSYVRFNDEQRGEIRIEELSEEERMVHDTLTNMKFGLIDHSKPETYQ
jgi:hypothetical protein